MMTKPLISICVPVYNGSAFLRDAIESVLRQTYHDLDIVVLDNASTDHTPDIIRSFKDSRIRSVRHDSNIGASGNFNAALAIARGDWIKIVCADDMIHPSCIDRQWSAISESTCEDVVLAACARDIIDGRGRRWMTRGYPVRLGREAGEAAIRRTVRSGTNIFGEPAAILMRRDVALEAGGFDPVYSFCVDVDLWVRMLERGSLVITPDALCSFRVSPTAWSVSLAHEQASHFRHWLATGGVARTPAVSAADRALGSRRAWLLMWQRMLFYGILSLR
jgi:glycosyltransferase involved in cell wall biosynthesis